MSATWARMVAVWSRATCHRLAWERSRNIILVQYEGEA